MITKIILLQTRTLLKVPKELESMSVIFLKEVGMRLRRENRNTALDRLQLDYEHI